jgi:lipoprotein-releasing system permease protein
VNPAVPVIFGLGLAALLSSVVLFLVCPFERFVGVRYLERSNVSRRVRVGLWCSLLPTALALAVFLIWRERSPGVATVSVLVTWVGTLFSILFVLLRIFSVFTTVSTMGVVLGVGSLVVVLSVTSGFEREFQDKVLGVNAHLIVTAYGIERDMGDAEREAEANMKKLRSLPNLVRMTKFSFSAGEVMIGRVGANLKGIDLGDGSPELRQARIEGSVDDLGRPATCPGETGTAPGRIFLGVELAKRARAKLGDCIHVLIPFSVGENQGTPNHFPFKVVGIFRMNFNEYDARLAFVPLEDARRLGNARQSVFGIELRFTDPLLALGMQDEIERRLGPEPRIIDWKTLNHNLFTALGMQKVAIGLILCLIILVAGFNIISSLMLVVMSKFREIAILGAMGARTGSVLRVFLVAGSFVGFAGIGLGILFGLVTCGLAALYQYQLDPKVYLIARLPVEISVAEVLFVAATTHLICFIFTIPPALKARKLKVVDGLRYI